MTRERFSNSDPPAPGRPRRRGTTLFELLITLSLVGVIAGSIVPIVRWSALQRVENERRLLAQEELKNLMGRAAKLPYDELTMTQLKDLALSADVAAVLPESRIAWSVDDEEDAVRSRRVQAELSWKLQNGQAVAPLRLTAWFHRVPEAGR